MINNYLLIVEGEKTEKTIFEKILTKYGFNVITKKKKIELEDDFFDQKELKKDKKTL